VTQVFQGQTVSKEYTFKDKAGVLMDPDTITVKIIDPSGAAVATPSMEGSEGVYEFNYNVESDAAKGVWIIFVTAVKGTNTEKKLDVFEVLLSR